MDWVLLILNNRKMKTKLNIILITLLMPVIMSYAVNEEIEAKYTGISENNEYMFIDESGEEYLFREIDSDIKIDLNDDTYIGEIFIVEFIYVELPIYDEEGEETGETEEILRITYLVQK